MCSVGARAGDQVRVACGLNGVVTVSYTHLDRSGKFVSYMAKTAECSIFDWWLSLIHI